MIQYYQLTPEILLEYIYEGDPKLNEDGIIGNTKDIYDDKTTLLNSNAFGTKYLFFNSVDSSASNPHKERNSISNLVLPLNNTGTQFVVAKSEYQNFYNTFNASNRFLSKNVNGYMYEDTEYDKNINKSCDVKYDKCIIHFTSRNFFGSYDSLIFQAYAYMKNKAKLYFASFLFTKTDFRELKAEHLLYNEKLYTTQIEFDIPSVFAIFLEKNKEEKIPFVTALESQNVNLLENTPIGINIFGVTGTIKGTDNYEKLNTLKINSISIPYTYNRLDEIHVNIYEACDDNSRKDGDLDGDFYYIEPEVSSRYSSFVEYIESMGENIQAYMVMHELCLKEVWVDKNGVTHSETTHKECHIITINEDDEDVDISKKFNEKIKYRPICTKSGEDYTAIIIDTIKIINIVDSSSYEITGSKVIDRPHKYGKKLKQLGIKNESRPIVNVYNKKVSDEKGTGTNGINLNRGGGFVVENNTQNITSFIECTNIGVSILEISPEEIN
jgi:hypothetical protein